MKKQTFKCHDRICFFSKNLVKKQKLDHTKIRKKSDAVWSNSHNFKKKA